eukprot:CAMPEP_0206471918 /NCGR_PEP_ID=MMETSP0324_2-20121206/31866_1 /ASSEMBLY_ACC=CAM_ASM_000836 /TAXON_ID=2866 /ORGANISM="Crypthecodinium cohnii, Strain Seligo" /LENGTH=408 /DNA_ID=CAMNT_0053946369 /DNA_START=62 /DNA_END=1288 /DNA_ORIENTATION=+
MSVAGSSPTKRPVSELLESIKGSATAAVHTDGLLIESCETAKRRMLPSRDVAAAISVSTTYETLEGGHIYSRATAPTRERCEALIGAIEGTPNQPAHACLYGSGLSAILGVLSRLTPTRVAITGGYHGTHGVLAQLKRISGGTKFLTVPLCEPEELGKTLSAGDVVWLETPNNPNCAVKDMAAYVQAAKKLDVRVVVDGTFAPPPLQRPLAFGVDVVMHSTTKYFAGHSDALGGLLCTSDLELAKALRNDRTELGCVPGSLETWLLLRSVRTMHLRVERQSSTATALATWFQEAITDKAHPLKGLIHAVHHPSLASSPDHAIAKKQMPGGFGAVFALELSTEAAAKALPAALHLFKDATSLGGVESLIEWRRKYDTQVSPLLLRVSCGVEDVEHLKADFVQGILAVSK